MEQCKSCVFYDAEYDELRRSGNDVQVVGENNDRHYCRFYQKGISDKIIKDERECEYHMPK